MRGRPRIFKSPLKYPIYIYAYQMAELVGWNCERVHNLWRKHGIAKEVNGWVVTTPAQIQVLWPEQWEAILDRLEEGKLDPPDEPALLAAYHARKRRLRRMKKAT